MENYSAMDIEAILDEILIPRPNGSKNLNHVGDFLNQQLAANGAEVTEHVAHVTPYGTQMVWGFAALMMLIYILCIVKKKYIFSLIIACIVPLILFLEFEKMKRPISGLYEAEARNIIGTWQASDPNAATLVFSAHYDTVTHFGDHYSWGPAGKAQGPATGIAIALALAGFILSRKKRHIPLKIALPILPLATAPFFAMFWFQTMGPHLREPSIGALDNGGSVTSLLLLAEKINQTPNLQNTIKIVFLTAEEERTQGSLALARTFNSEDTFVFNLENIGASDRLIYLTEDGWATRRYRSSERIVNHVTSVSNAHYGEVIPSPKLPFGVLTDTRSFLSNNIDAVTIRALEKTPHGYVFPRYLNSPNDTRDRLSSPAIQTGSEFLYQLAITRAQIHM